MYLFHGTSAKFDKFSRDAFLSRGDGSDNGLLGVWASMTPQICSMFGAEVLLLRLKSSNIIECANKYLFQVETKLSSEPGFDPLAFYADLAAGWQAQGADVVAVMEEDGIGNLIVLDPDNIEIVERVDANDVERLLELDDLVDTALLSRRSCHVSLMYETVAQPAYR